LLRVSTFNFIKCYAPISISSLNAAPLGAAACHDAVVPFEVKRYPFAPIEIFPIVLSAVPISKSPTASIVLILGVVRTGEVKVKPAIVVTVAPEAIDVDPNVGAEYPETVPQESVPEPSVVKYFPELEVCDGSNAAAAEDAVVAPVPPFAIAIVVPVHVPEVIVPTDVSEDPVTPEPRVDAESTVVPLIS
jgi:hypothetical protein